MEVGKEYPDITPDYAHVDATSMWMVKNPEWFDVIVTDNMFGDIITDLGAMIQGGMGIAAGGNLNPAGSLDVRADRRLRPKVHGAERHQPGGRDPRGGMMLEQLGSQKAADAVEKSVVAVIAKMNSMAAGDRATQTSQIGDMVAAGL